MRDFSSDDFWNATNNMISCMDKILAKRKNKRNAEKSKACFSEILLDTKLSESENSTNLKKKVIDHNALIVLDSLIKDMYQYNFAKSSSVGGKIKNLTMNGSVEKLKTINLLEHSFGVVNFMNKIISKRYGGYTDLFLILAIVHDFGKSEELRKAFMLDSTFGHWKASSQYLESKVKSLKIASHYEKLIQIAVEVVNVHHDKDASIIFNPIGNKNKKSFHQLLLTKLIEADSEQREAELKKLASAAQYDL